MFQKMKVEALTSHLKSKKVENDGNTDNKRSFPIDSLHFADSFRNGFNELKEGQRWKRSQRKVYLGIFADYFVNSVNLHENVGAMQCQWFITS